MLSTLFVRFVATCINLGYYSFTCMNNLPIPYRAKVSDLYICNIILFITTSLCEQN